MVYWVSEYWVFSECLRLEKLVTVQMLEIVDCVWVYAR